MGFKPRNKAKQPTDIAFETLDLNESNVNMMFERCLAKAGDDSLSNDYISLLDEMCGFSQTDAPIGFNRKAIETNRRNILYLVCQLEKVHSRNNAKSFEYSQASIKYDGTQWTVSSANLSKLFYLATACYVTGTFRKENDKTIVDGFIYLDAMKTLSPNDPNFAKWWAEHKAEWEDAPEK